MTSKNSQVLIATLKTSSIGIGSTRYGKNVFADGSELEILPKFSNQVVINSVSASCFLLSSSGGGDCIAVDSFAIEIVPYDFQGQRVVPDQFDTTNTASYISDLSPSARMTLSDKCNEIRPFITGVDGWAVSAFAANFIALPDSNFSLIYKIIVSYE